MLSNLHRFKFFLHHDKVSSKPIRHFLHIKKKIFLPSNESEKNCFLHNATERTAGEREKCGGFFCVLLSFPPFIQREGKEFLRTIGDKQTTIFSYFAERENKTQNGRAKKFFSESFSGKTLHHHCKLQHMRISAKSDAWRRMSVWVPGEWEACKINRVYF